MQPRPRACKRERERIFTFMIAFVGERVAVVSHRRGRLPGTDSDLREVGAKGKGEGASSRRHPRCVLIARGRGRLGGRRRRRGGVVIVTSSSSPLSSSRGDGDGATGDGDGARRSHSCLCGKLRALWKERWVGNLKDEKSTLQDLRSCKWDFFFLLGFHLDNCICLTSWGNCATIAGHRGWA